jgi:hypothetical protein
MPALPEREGAQVAFNAMASICFIIGFAISVLLPFDEVIELMARL